MFTVKYAVNLFLRLSHILVYPTLVGVIMLACWASLRSAPTYKSRIALRGYPWGRISKRIRMFEKGIIPQASPATSDKQPKIVTLLQPSWLMLFRW